MQIVARMLLRTWLLIGAVLSLLLLVAAGTDADAASVGLLGADHAISQIEGALGTEKKPASTAAESNTDALMRDISRFKATRGSMAPAAAADAWLKLYDRFWMLPSRELMTAKEFGPRKTKGGPALSATELIEALPEPSAWDELKKRVLASKRSGRGPQESVLAVLVHYLTKDRKNLDAGIAALKVDSGGKANYMADALRLKASTLAEAKDEKSVADAFDAYLASLQAERPEGVLTVNVPDLVEPAGEQRAAALIRKALTLPGVTLRVPSGGTTLALAKRLVREHASSLVEPQWPLVTSTEDVELYEAIEKRFPDAEKAVAQGAAAFQDPGKRNYGYFVKDVVKQRARLHYLMGLIAKNRMNDAVALAKKFDAETVTSSDFDRTWQSFEKLRYAGPLTQFCAGLLQERPDLPLWGQCGVVATGPEARQGLVRTAEAAASKHDLSAGARARIQEHRVALLLAIDRVDDAIDLLGKIIAADVGKEAAAEQQAVFQVKLKMMAKMCELGKLLNRSDLIARGAELALAAIGKTGRGPAKSMWSVDAEHSPVTSIVEVLLERGEFLTAEKIVLEQLLVSLGSPQIEMVQNRREMLIRQNNLVPYLTGLARIYDRAGRPADVLKLLEGSPFWGAFDLLQIADRDPKLPPIVAKALHKSGRNAEATDILRGHLYGYPGDDAAYQALIAVSGAAIIPWLDELYARDRFEERPLIWKATLLKEQGKLEEAEAAARRAVKIDPTDGEQKAGDRGRAYVVLADILKVRGKKDDAAFFGRVVESVRTAEEGDAFTKAGLLRRSLAYYEKAAAAFADAYCVQWRLAERMAAVGDHEGARKHYKIAFERMPEQFGQVANVCFGCEGMFTHDQSQGVAEQVLTKLAQTAGDKPQVQYLLGQLRESQGRKTEALRHYRKAAQLDPDYLDAWKAAYDLRADVFLRQADADELALQIIRQDPMQRHAHIDSNEVFDQKGLWEAYGRAGRQRVQLPARLLTLTASKAAIESLLKKYNAPGDYYEMWSDMYVKKRQVPEPGEVLAMNQFVQSLIRYLLNASVGM